MAPEEAGEELARGLETALGLALEPELALAPEEEPVMAFALPAEE